jgi:hypothetical protein
LPTGRNNRITARINNNARNIAKNLCTWGDERRIARKISVMVLANIRDTQEAC